MKKTLLLLLAACASEGPAPKVEIPTPPLYTPRWAFEPWISKDISDGPDTYAFVEGFRSRKIPVGVVVLDSPWETNYNSFRPNERRYPEFAKMVSELRAQDIRVVVWCTQMLNEDSFDLEDGGDTYDGPAVEYLRAKKEGWLVDDGRLYRWWKGSGAGIDFFHEGARDYWHSLLDRVLDLGVAGFKLDFGESYITSDPIKTAKGLVPHQEYSEEYYRAFYAYGVHKRGREEFTTMVRPYDESYQFAGRFFARRAHAPVAWVGDNRRDFVGLADALDHLFRSMKAGYVTIGSDIGGYLDRDDQDLTVRIPPNTDAFLRWTAMGAMTPFMQLHGRANLAPWTTDRPGETVRAYRYWSTLHSELVPFFYSLAIEAAKGSGPMLHPEGEEADWPGDYRFRVGEAFLVAPILDARGVRDVMLPPGEWHDWWRLEGPALGGPQRAVDAGDPGRIPLYLRAGAIVPLAVSSTITGFPAGPTWLFAEGPGRFVLHDETGEVVLEGARGRFTASRVPAATTLIVRTSTPSAVRVDGSMARHEWDGVRRRMSIALPTRSGAVDVSW